MSHDFYGQFWPVDPIQWSSGKKDVTEPAEFNIRIQTKPDLNHTMAYNSSGVPQETFFTTKFNIVIAPKPGYTLKQAKDAAYKYVQSMTDRNVFTEFWFDSTYLYNIVRILDFSTSSENGDVYNGLSGTIDVVMSSLRFRNIKMVTGSKELDTINLRDGVELDGDEYQTVQLYGNVMVPALDYTRETNYTREPLKFDNTADTAPLVTTDSKEEKPGRLEAIKNKNKIKEERNNPSNYKEQLRIIQAGIPVVLDKYKYKSPYETGVWHLREWKTEKEWRSDPAKVNIADVFVENRLVSGVLPQGMFFPHQFDSSGLRYTRRTDDDKIPLYDPDAWLWYSNPDDRKKEYIGTLYYTGGIAVETMSWGMGTVKYEDVSYPISETVYGTTKRPYFDKTDISPAYEAHAYPIADVPWIMALILKTSSVRYWGYSEFWYYSSIPGSPKLTKDGKGFTIDNYIGDRYNGRFVNASPRYDEYRDGSLVEMTQTRTYTGPKYRVGPWIPDWKKALLNKPWLGELPRLYEDEDKDADDPNNDTSDKPDNPEVPSENYEYKLTTYREAFTLEEYSKYNNKEIDYLEQPDAIAMVRGLIAQGTHTKEMFADYTIPYGYDLAQLKELFRETRVAYDKKVVVDKPIETPRVAEELSKSQLVVSPSYVNKLGGEWMSLAGEDVTEFKKKDAQTLANMVGIDFTPYSEGFDFVLLKDKLVDMGVLEYVVPGTYVQDGMLGDYEILDEYPDEVLALDNIEEEDSEGRNGIKLRYKSLYFNGNHCEPFIRSYQLYPYADADLFEKHGQWPLEWLASQNLAKLPSSYRRWVMIGLGETLFKIGTDQRDRWLRGSSPATIENDLVELGFLYRKMEYKTLYEGTHEYERLMKDLEARERAIELRQEWAQKAVEEADKLNPPKENPLDEEDVVDVDQYKNMTSEFPNEDTEFGKKLKELLEKGISKTIEDGESKDDSKIQHSNTGYVSSAYLPAYVDPSIKNPPKVLSQTLLSINNTFSLSNIGNINIDRYRNIYVDQRYSNKLLGIYPWIPSSNHMPQIHTIVSAVYTEVV